MSQLDKERNLVIEHVKKFERTAEEIHALADKLHKKMEKLHLEAVATRQRARAIRQAAKTKSIDVQKLVAVKPRKIT
jgi:hypothetical protein